MRKKLSLSTISVFALFLLLISNNTNSANDSVNNLKVVLLTIPGVTLDDLLAFKNDPDSNMNRIMHNGAIGLMNSRTAGRIPENPEAINENPKYTPESGYLTIGAGARAAAGSSSWNAYNANTPLEGSSAGSVYRRQTLIDPGNSKIVHPDIPRIERDNAVFNYKITIGLLGTALKSAGVTRSVFGNSDDIDLHREIVMLAMDSDGLVDEGNVESLLATDETEYLLHNESDKMLKEIRHSINTDKPGFIAVEYGDFARLERAMPDMTDAAYIIRKKDLLKKADGFIGNLENAVGKNGILIILSPYPSFRSLRKTGNSMCPILVTGHNIGKGLLTSGSTRIHGVVTNLDITLSILGWFGLPIPTEVVGRPITVTRSSYPLARLDAINGDATKQATNIPVLRQAAGVLIGIAVLTLLMWFTVKDRAKRDRIVCAAALLPPAMLPALLLTGIIPWVGLLSTWIFVSTVTLILFLVLRFTSKNPMQSFMNMGIIFTTLAVVDVLTGGRMCGQSIIGYSIVDGSRFYGMGNEVMGALTGATLAGIGLLSVFGKWSLGTTRIVLAAGMIFGAVLIGTSGLGANTGGAISIVTAFGAALVVLSQRKLDIKGLLKIASGVIIVLAVLIAYDVMRGQSAESHLGRAFGALTSGGYDEIGLLIKRKLAMNLILIKASIWSKLLLVYLIAIVVLIGYKNAMKVNRSRHIGYRIAVAGISAGMAAAFIFNDSGVVAAGTCVIYLWSLIVIASCETEDLGGIPG
ncbi:MAG: hypothetical protein ACYC0V_14305 [Armatimonadota bacterium]